MWYKNNLWKMQVAEAVPWWKMLLHSCKSQITLENTLAQTMICCHVVLMLCNDDWHFVPLKTFSNICDRIFRRKRVVQPLISPVESSRTIVERHWTAVPVRPSRNALMDTVSELERNDLRFHFTLHSYWKVGNYSHVHQALNFEWPLKFETTV